MDRWEEAEEDEETKDDDDEMAPGNGDEGVQAHRRAMKLAAGSKRPGQTLEQRFAEIWLAPEMTKQRNMQKSAHLARIAKAYGY
jgi:hypothetical protein